MSIASELSRLLAAKAAIRASIIAKGVSVDAGLTLEDYAARIDLITGGGASAPAAFVTGNWTATVTSDTTIDVNITALPSDGGSSITALQYRLNGGTAVAFTGTGTGVRTISALSASTAYDIEIRAVNAIGAGAWSDVKARTTSAASGGSAAFQSVGAPTFGTLGGAGTTPGRPAGITATDLLVLYVTNIATAQRAGMVVPTGWTFRGEVYSDFSGLGHAIYTASGTVADAAWTSSSVSNAAFDMHRISGANLSSPVRDIQFRTSATWPNFEDNDMPSPAATATAGDMVISHYTQPQSATVVGTPTSGYTRRVDSNTPNRRSTLTRDNVGAGSTGEISHSTVSSYEGRTTSTLVVARA